jgi:hypothetical protein
MERAIRLPRGERRVDRVAREEEVVVGYAPGVE